VGEHHLYDIPVREVPIEGLEGADLVVFAEPFVPPNVGFRHHCSSWPDESEDDGILVKVVAPRLSRHTFTGPEDEVTIRASISCPDCGLHGYVTDGVWRNV
jgi:hypothetical protein